jgi:YegS/Rv2252/BmrU family lipid kinase
MSRRIKLIFNPHADRGRSWDIAASLQPIIERHGGASWSATEYPTHATEIAEQAALEGYEVIAAIGGDGTIHEIVNGLMNIPHDKRPLLGAVPIGSGNDFCFNVGIPLSAEVAMENIFRGETIPLDVGEIRDNTGHKEYWNNVLGIGFDANVLIQTMSITRLQGFSMYFWALIQTILSHYDSWQMKIETSEESFDSDVLMFVVGNGAREGGGFNVTPDAKVNDGIFHYAMIPYVNKAMMMRLIPEVMRGTHGKFKQVRMGTLTSMHLVADSPLVIHTDGEVYAGSTSTVTDLNLSIHPSALRLII